MLYISHLQHSVGSKNYSAKLLTCNPPDCKEQTEVTTISCNSTDFKQMFRHALVYFLD